MASVKLIIRKSLKNRRGDCLIFCQYCHGYKTLLLSTGQTVRPEYWNTSRQCVKNSYLGHNSVNMLIERKAQQIMSFAREAILLGTEPTTEYIKERIRGKKEKKKGIPSLFKFIELYANEQTNLKRKLTIRGYWQVYNKLKEYQDYTGKPINYNIFDMPFYNTLTKYFFEKKNLNMNSVGSFWKTLKHIMREAEERGYHTNKAYEKFQVLKRVADTIALTYEEVEILFNLNLSDSPRLDRIRDAFIVGCNTALRYSDLKRLSAANVDGDKIRILTQKTSADVTLPILPMTRGIMDKYLLKTGQPFPKWISDQQYNNGLKELCKRAGFDKLIMVQHTTGGKISQKQEYMYNLVTSHTARRTAASVMARLGLDTALIQYLTGHKDLKVLQTAYIKVTKDEMADKIKKQFEDKVAALVK